jgi:hypothetical protein
MAIVLLTEAAKSFAQAGVQVVQFLSALLVKMAIILHWEAVIDVLACA